MDSLDANNPIKEYTGVWIPAEVMESDVLEPLDKLVYGEIASFRECYGSNEWLAKRVKRSVRTVIDSVNKLVKLGFVERSGFNGRFRTLRHTEFRSSDMQNSACLPCEISHTENKVKNKVKSISNDSGEPQSGGVKKSEYGNHEINALLELWEHETGITANVAKANRLAAYNLIRKKGFEGAKAVVELVGRAIKSGDQYAPRVASFRDLQGQYEKLSKLEAWEARRSAPVERSGVGLDFYSDAGADDYVEISDEQRERNRQAILEARERLGFKRGGYDGE